MEYSEGIQGFFLFDVNKLHFIYTWKENKEPVCTFKLGFCVIWWTTVAENIIWWESGLWFLTLLLIQVKNNTRLSLDLNILSINKHRSALWSKCQCCDFWSVFLCVCMNSVSCLTLYTAVLTCYDAVFQESLPSAGLPNTKSLLSVKGISVKYEACC